MNKRYILLTAIITALFSQQVSTTEDQGPELTATRSPQKINDHFNFTTILPADFAATQYTISTGGFYKLSANTTVTTGSSSGNINITANGVVLDLNGTAITGNATTSNGIAINIAAGVKEVTIRNGAVLGTSSSNAFYHGIKVGASTSRIRLEDLTVEGCIHANGAVWVAGGSGTEVTDVTMKNITVIGGTAATAFKHINVTYANRLRLENVHSVGATNSTSGILAAIFIGNSNTIVGTNVSSTNHTGVAICTALDLLACNSVTFTDLNLANNDGAAGANTTGVKCTSCNNVTLNNVAINDLADAKNGAWILTSTDVTLNNMKISNCASGTSAALVTVLADNSQNVRVLNSTITNNTGTTAFSGITTQTAGCKNLLVDNVEVTGNTAAAGNCYGIALAATLSASILNSTVSQNDCSSTADSAFHVRGIFADGSSSSVSNLLIENCQTSGNSRAAAATNAASTVSGIWLDTVTGCSVLNTEASINTGSAQAFGVYVDTTDNLVMDGCVAQGNAAGTTGSGDTGGIAALPSAGIYLLSSNGAQVSNSQFINNKAGNQNNGHGADAENTGATVAIDVTSCCGGFGIANVVTSTSVLNTGNTFTNCICTRNGTQISNSALTTDGGSGVDPDYQGTGGARRAWESEAISAGAIEQNTNGTSFTSCSFSHNGLSQYVTSYGLCVSNGTSSVVEAPKVSYCSFEGNGFYGLYDDNATTTVITAEGTSSSGNGSTNAVAVATTASESTRNWNMNGATSMYQSAANDDFSAVGVQANAKVNWNHTTTAAG